MRIWIASCLVVLLGCGNPVPSAGSEGNGRSPAKGLAAAEVVKPPFAVQGEAEGLLLVWYDAEGKAQTATTRGDIPEDRRARVRVDSLDVAPDQRLDPAFVYVADLSRAQADGSYVVRKVERERFESEVVPARAEVAVASNDVILYGASWCGACKAAKAHFTRRGVPFVEKDIEKEPGARSEMLAKAEAQGVRTTGIPVLDVKGKILAGFDPGAVDRALSQ